MTHSYTRAALISAASLMVLAACSGEQSAGNDAGKAEATKHAEHASKGHNIVVEPETRLDVPPYVDNFRLVDHTGTGHELFYHADAKAVVLMTHGNGCPIVRGAIPDLAAIRDQYEDQGVKFLLINSSLQDSRADVLAEAEEFGIDFPILMDDHQIIGESLGYDRTAQVYVLDPKKGFKVAYHGPLNDRLDYERQKAEAENNYVVEALDAVLAGEPVTVEAPALSPGCLINFPERKKQAQHANISYTNDVVPILKERCVECHQDGGIGSWAMTDYDTIQGWAPMIREVIRTDRMPPWHADSEVGTFKGDRSLTGEQIKTLVHWIEADAPRGEGEDPLAGLEMKAPEWPLGEPDLILTLPAQDVPATGIVDYTYPIVENPMTEDRWLKATTIKVGSRETVHHVLSGYMPEIPADGKGYNDRWINETGGYAVGAESNIQPPNSGVHIPAGGAIGFQMHYTPYGKEVTDVTQIGFYFHEEMPELLNRQSVVIDASIVIPPGASRHQETAYVEFPYDATLLTAFPHAHYRGHSSNLRLRYPDGTEKMLISLPKYDFNWQRQYEFEEPIKIPAGSKLIADYTYDNSGNNPANPDPETLVLWGEQSHEEMLFTAFTYRWDGETTTNRKDQQHQVLQINRHFGAMDDNIDGELQEAELRGALGQQFKQGFSMMDADKNGTVSSQEFLQFQIQRARSTGGQP
ncbi:MAG: redoxin domain-containing protein [Aquisalinus sp.]|nr:redoxin domain-containing protein [Aquisalinus sp.]